ncbi:MAG: hypothetical protein M1820_004565 [Bogoriella megaspora]|nr:MAG: hypothetical protein M1820_004565 [Bogoriella megaspora]
MGVQPLPPYIFPPDSRTNLNPTYDFDPKAITRASYASSHTKSEKAKQDGPLLNYNRHPDSWIQAPYGQLDAVPMSPKTRAAVKWTRWVQLAFRSLQLIGALGALFCVIVLKGMLDSQAWIVRVPPAVDILTTLYAIVHLSRKPTSRTPGSSASYHLFALVIDLGVVPFYAFTAVFARMSAIEDVGATGRWRTLFAADTTTNLILELTWLIAAVNGGMHLVSFGLDIYLILVFRKIASMPPDLNPLEDNLTSRRATKHKYKNSELSASTGAATDSARNSYAFPLPDNRLISFLQTRNESNTSFSPHNPETARLSRTNLSMYSQPQSARTSRADLHRRDGSISPSKSGTTVNVREIQPRSPTRHSTRTNVLSHQGSVHNALSDISSHRGTPGPFPRSGTSTPNYTAKDGLLSDNWFVIDSDADGGDISDNVPSPAVPPRHPRHSAYARIPTIESDMEPENDENFVPRPLRMNPPTPVQPLHPQPRPQQYRDIWNEPGLQQDLNHLSVGDVARTLTVTSSSSRYSSPPPTPSPPRGASPKSRYYGDLKSATSGILSKEKSRGSLRAVEPSNPMRPGKVSPAKPLVREGNARVVSRSGVDVADASVLYVPEGQEGKRGKREVSGKIAEEGRGTWFRRREPSGRA